MPVGGRRALLHHSILQHTLGRFDLPDTLGYKFTRETFGCGPVTEKMPERRMSSDGQSDLENCSSFFCPIRAAEIRILLEPHCRIRSDAQGPKRSKNFLWSPQGNPPFASRHCIPELPKEDERKFEVRHTLDKDWFLLPQNCACSKSSSSF